MSVRYMLAQAGKKIGLSPASASERTVLVRLLNEAAKEIYDQESVDGILMEMAFKVNGDQTLSLPWYVGSPKAVRELTTFREWHIHKMRPRYNQYNWKDMFKNIRLKNCQALMATVVNTSIGVLTTPVVENPPINVTVVGPTDTASQASEVVTMSSTTVKTVNTYNDYITVAKDRINEYDITMLDVDGKPLTIIPNCRYEAIYQIIDVSAFPFLNLNQSPLNNYLEVLYKRAWIDLYNDWDSFPAKNTTSYDDIIVNKMIQTYLQEQGKVEQALAYDSLTTRSLARKKADQNSATEDEIALVRNPHDQLHARISGGRFSRDAYRRGWYQ